eukprot:scaffold73953_cov32-Tisochrysis_lutea.AAC.13
MVEEKGLISTMRSLLISPRASSGAWVTCAPAWPSTSNVKGEGVLGWKPMAHIALSRTKATGTKRGLRKATCEWRAISPGGRRMGAENASSCSARATSEITHPCCATFASIIPTTC